MALLWWGELRAEREIGVWVSKQMDCMAVMVDSMWVLRVGGSVAVKFGR